MLICLRTRGFDIGSDLNWYDIGPGLAVVVHSIAS
jgi:hypothetical protein